MSKTSNQNSKKSSKNQAKTIKSNPKNLLSVPSDKPHLLSFLKKNQLFLTSLVFMILLAVLVIAMSNLFDYATTADDVANEIAINFDQKTIDQIKELSKFDDQAAPNLPSNIRINPFLGE